MKDCADHTRSVHLGVWTRAGESFIGLLFVTGERVISPLYKDTGQRTGREEEHSLSPLTLYHMALLGV